MALELSSRRARAAQSQLICAGNRFLPRRRPSQSRRRLGRGDADFAAQVDYVLVGRVVSGDARFGLARWSEVLEVIRRAGMDPTSDPVKLEYHVTPAPIADWVADITLINHDALERLSADQILDDELIAEARDFETKVICDSSNAQGME
jgi:hypothetical protein